MGLVSVSYTVVSNTPGIKFFYTVTTGNGGMTYNGFPTSISYNIIPNTTWFESHITLMAVTKGSRYTSLNNNESSSGGVVFPTWWQKKK
jgi:hypothetical protein